MKPRSITTTEISDPKADRKKLLVLSLMAVCAVAAATNCFAVTAASNTYSGFGQDFYDFANAISSGWPGKTVGIGGLALAGFCLFKQAIMPAAGAIIGTIAILKAPSIVDSFGYLF